MYYTASPTADYERFAADGDADEARIERDRTRWTEIIKDGFETMGKVPYLMGTCSARFQSFEETVADLVAEDKVFDELVTVLKTSECAKVKALLVSMQAKWVEQWVDVLAAEAEPAYPARVAPKLQLVRTSPAISVQRVDADDTEGGAA